MHPPVLGRPSGARVWPNPSAFILGYFVQFVNP